MDKEMYDSLVIVDILEDTVVDGPGLRTSIYSAGCPHCCPGCHNPESWDIEQGKVVSLDYIMSVIKSSDFADVTFSGGDPMFQPEAFTCLARRIKKETGKNIWCYTGYRYEVVSRTPRLAAILPFIDVLVDGPFIQGLRDVSLLFRGSSNQRLIDVQTSLAESRVVEYEYQPFCV